MENLTRRREIVWAATIAIVTIAAIMIAKAIGAILIGAFLAGAGAVITIGFVIIANILIRRARRKK